MKNVIESAGNKRKYWGRLLMLMVSVAMGGLGVYLANDYINNEVEGYRQQFAKSETMVDVVVPSRNLSRGEIVSESVMSVRKIPAQYVDTHSVTTDSFGQVQGQRLDFDIDAGTALLWAHLEGGTSPTFSGRVPDGQRALTVRVDEINSVSGFLQPKDRIDLIFTHGTGDKQKVRPLIENLSVIATGFQTMVDKSNYGAQRGFTTITVQVNPLEAKKITLAQQIGNLTAVLRNPEDTNVVEPDVLTLSSLLGVPESSKTSHTPRKVSPESIVKPSVEYIIGGQR